MQMFLFEMASDAFQHAANRIDGHAVEPDWRNAQTARRFD
jgi:hypothetical protein